MGRKRVTHKGPRIIDLDILLYNSYIIKTKSVTIPHEELNKRFFFIELLMELDPEIKDPRSKKTFKEIVNHGNTLNQ
jgi:7,8-dihydro-6-hydroxymethylpterin-pyrophosphokinase